MVAQATGCTRYLLLGVLATIAYCQQITKMMFNYTLVEGEVYFHDFEKAMFMGQSDSFVFSPSHENMIKNTTYNAVVNNRTTFGKSDRADKLPLTVCQVTNVAGHIVIALVYTKDSNSVNGSSSYVVEIKDMVHNISNEALKNGSNWYFPPVVVTDKFAVNVSQEKVVSSSECSNFMFVHEFKRVLMLCAAQNGQQFFMLTLCSDNSCNEQIEALKVQDYVPVANKLLKRIGVMRMPGLNEQSFGILIWYRGTQYIEYMLYDVSGVVSSEVFKLDFPITHVRYYAGQLLVFISELQNVTRYYYLFSDFGVKKIDFGKIKPKLLSNFGGFINGFVHPHSGELMIELLDDRTLTDLSFDRLLNEFIVEYSKPLFTVGEVVRLPRDIRVFEMSSHFQTVTISPPPPNNTNSGQTRNAIESTKIATRFDVINTSLPLSWGTKQFASSIKMPGFHRLVGCWINSNVNDSQYGKEYEIYEQVFVEPVLPVYTEGLVPIAGATAYQLNISKPGTGSQPLQTVDFKVISKGEFKIGKKTITAVNGSKVLIETQGLSSDNEYVVKKLLKGNFLAIKSLGLPGNRPPLTFLNRINPLLYYRTLASGRGNGPSEIDECQSMLAAATTIQSIQTFEVLAYRQDLQTVSMFSSNSGNFVKRRTDTIKVKFDNFELYNETIFVIHSDQNLYMYDTKAGSIKELIFDSGKCEKVLIVRHPDLDLTLWCFANVSVTAYYARDVIEGKAGIRKIPVILEGSLNFTDRIIRFNEYYPNYFVIMSRQGIVEMIKIECANAITIKRVSEIPLGESNRLDIRVLDFEMIDQYLMIYQAQTIGYGNRIILSFYFIRTVNSFIQTKKIEMDYKFSSVPSDPRIFRFEDKSKFGASNSQYANTPLLLIKVKMTNDRENVLFIDVKAPLSETIPFTLMTLSSNVASIKIGKTLYTNDAHTRSSIIVYYKYAHSSSTPTNTVPAWSLIKLDELDPNLKLSTLFEQNLYYARRVGLEVFRPTWVEFEADLISGDTEPILNFTFTYTSSGGFSERHGNQAKVSFNSAAKTDINLKKLLDSNNTIIVPNKPNATLFYTVDIQNLTFGDVARWQGQLESFLEHISEIVEFKSLARSKKLLNAEDVKKSTYFQYMANCTFPRRDYMVIDIEGQPSRVTVDFHLCIDAANIVIFAQVHHPKIPGILSAQRANNLMTSNPISLRVFTDGSILELMSLRKLGGRQVFTDFYHIFFNLTDVANPVFMVKWVTRRLFSETIKDYLLRPLITEKTATQEYFEYTEWNIQQTVSKSYSLTVAYEKWQITQNQVNNTIANISVVDQHQIRLELNQSLENGMQIDLYDEFSLKVLDKGDDQFIWLLLESQKYEGYILRYDRNSILTKRDNKTKAEVWRLSNPFYGFDLAYEVKSAKSDWLMVGIKPMGDTTTVLIYVVPTTTLLGKGGSTIYVRESINLTQVIDFKVAKSISSVNETCNLRCNFRQRLSHRPELSVHKQNHSIPPRQQVRDSNRNRSSSADEV